MVPVTDGVIWHSEFMRAIQATCYPWLWGWGGPGSAKSGGSLWTAVRSRFWCYSYSLSVLPSNVAWKQDGCSNLWARRDQRELQSFKKTKKGVDLGIWCYLTLYVHTWEGSRGLGVGQRCICTWLTLQIRHTMWLAAYKARCCLHITVSVLSMQLSIKKRLCTCLQTSILQSKESSCTRAGSVAAAINSLKSTKRYRCVWRN